MRLGGLLRSAAALVVATALVAGAASTAPSAPPVAHTASSMHLSFRLPELEGEGYAPNAKNLAMRSAVAGPLLLFLPATGAVPRDYRSFLDVASSLGYHVLALDYWNLGLSVARTCGTDPQCYGDVQANRFDGSHPNRYSAISPRNSILARLTHALSLLRAHDPDGGWARYLSGDHVRWDRVVLAGHSQGGGESAFIAHHHLVHGVLMFASPVTSDGTVVATWLTAPGVTPMSRYYGFDDTNDVYYQRIQGSWQALGLEAGHGILTQRGLGTPGEAHGRVVSDDGPRGHDGAPVFADIWRGMLAAVRHPQHRV